MDWIFILVIFFSFPFIFLLLLQTKDPNTAFRVELVDALTPQRSLQIWRMSDLIYRPEEEVLAELEKYVSHVIECTSKS